jgi:hypothetical protein
MTKHGERYPIDVRFWKKVVCLIGKDGCWEWTGSIQTAGYGTIRVGGRTLQAHRVSFEMHNGRALAASDLVCHRCDNRKCVNPDHLWIGSVGMNNADRHAKGRSRGARFPGASNPMSKLTENDIREIRSCSSNLSDTARRYGIAFGTVSDIRLRKTWKHVT